MHLFSEPQIREILNQELDLDLSLIRSRSGATMASDRPSLFDYFQANGSGHEISDNDPDFLPEDRFSDSDSSYDIDLRNVSNSSRDTQSQPDDTQSLSDSRSKSSWNSSSIVMMRPMSMM